MSAEYIHTQVISDKQFAAASTTSIGETLYDIILDKVSANSDTPTVGFHIGSSIQ